MRIAAYDPHLGSDLFEPAGAERFRQLEGLLAASDAVTLHCPLTPETRGMFGREAFAAMRPGAYFVNTARGGIVRLDALREALESGRIAAAGLDVFEEEPMRPDHPILKSPNVIATPHVAFYSERSVRRVAAEAMEEVLRTLAGERPHNLVNPEVYAARRK